jgi:hypothetical protein
MDKISWLIEGTQLKIETFTTSTKQNREKVFVLRAEFYPDQLIQFIYTFTDNPSAISAPLPNLPILMADK